MIPGVLFLALMCACVYCANLPICIFIQTGLGEKGVVLQRAPAYKIIILQLALVNDVLMCDALCALILFYHLPC